MDKHTNIKRLHMFMGLQCNVRCAMCYQYDFSSRYNMPPQIYRDKLRDIWPMVKVVKIQGGEPTIMENCKELVEIITRHDQPRITIATNGVVLSSFWKESLLSHGESVNFSINAATKNTYDQIVKHGNFNRVLKNINRLTSSRDSKVKTPKIDLSMVVLNNNVFEIDKLVHLARELGVDNVKFLTDNYLSFRKQNLKEQVRHVLQSACNTATDAGLSIEGLSSLIRGFGVELDGKAVSSKLIESSKPKKICPMPFRSLVVDADGSVRPCCNTWIKAGNLNNETIKDITEGATLQRFRSKLRKGDYSWCIPNCPDNPRPSSTAMLRKYIYTFREDPHKFIVKVRRKLASAAGNA